MHFAPPGEPQICNALQFAATIKVWPDEGRPAMRAQRLVILLLATGAAASRFGASLKPAQSHELLQSSLKNARPQAQLGNPNAGSPTSDAPRSPTDTRYAVVVDCGSSGTRAIVYSWPANVSSSAATDIALGVRPLRAPDGRPLSKRIRPGLASVRRNPNEASDYMQPRLHCQDPSGGRGDSRQVRRLTSWLWLRAPARLTSALGLQPAITWSQPMRDGANAARSRGRRER